MRAPVPTTLLLSVSLVVAGFTPGCTTRPYANAQEQAQNACRSLGPKALSGALIGGLGGAAGGAAIGAATGQGKNAAIGALAGLAAGVIGGLIVGNNLDARDCAEAKAALQTAGTAPIGQAVAWNNPETGSNGRYVPVSAVTNTNGRVCRRVRADYYIKNHEPVVGDTSLICRTPEGDWQTVTSAA